MELDFGTLNNLLYLIGELTVIIIVVSVVSAFVLVVISLYSIRKGRLYFPRVLKTGLVLLEGLMKAMFRFFGLEDRELFTFLIMQGVDVRALADPNQSAAWADVRIAVVLVEAAFFIYDLMFRDESN